MSTDAGIVAVAPAAASVPTGATRQPIRYLDGGPLRIQRRLLRAAGPVVETLIWWPGQAGWLSDIIAQAWRRWLSFHPGEWRRLAEAVPYVHLRRTFDCDRPKTATLSATERRLLAADPAGAHDEWAHTHLHDHGICLDPDVVRLGILRRLLRHELVHAISGAPSHDQLWLAMCRVIGYVPDPRELDHDIRSGRRE